MTLPSLSAHKGLRDKRKKVKCTLVQKLRLCTGRTAHRRSRGIALLFIHHGTRRGWEVSVTPRPFITPGKDPVPIVQQAGWVPGPVWTGAENLVPTGIRSPDRPGRSQSLYQLRHPAHHKGLRRETIYCTSFRFTPTCDVTLQLAVEKQWRFIGVWQFLQMTVWWRASPKRILRQILLKTEQENMGKEVKDERTLFTAFLLLDDEQKRGRKRRKKAGRTKKK